MQRLHSFVSVTKNKSSRLSKQEPRVLNETGCDTGDGDGDGFRVGVAETQDKLAVITEI
jgi:hypothetical protein